LLECEVVNVFELSAGDFSDEPTEPSPSSSSSSTNSIGLLAQAGMNLEASYVRPCARGLDILAKDKELVWLGNDRRTPPGGGEKPACLCCMEVSDMSLLVREDMPLLLGASKLLRTDWVPLEGTVVSLGVRGTPARLWCVYSLLVRVGPLRL